MSLRFSTFAAVLAFGLSIVGCDSAPREAATPVKPATKAADKPTDAGTGPILVGEYGSLTGAEATFGQSTHEGIMLAVDQINAGGGVKGRPLEVITLDDQGKSQEAGTVVTRLITENHVVAVLGEVGEERWHVGDTNRFSSIQSR